MDRNRFKGLTYEKATQQAGTAISRLTVSMRASVLCRNRPAERLALYITALTPPPPLPRRLSQGIRTAKLPLGEHLKMLGSKVLTVNQVRAVA